MLAKENQSVKTDVSALRKLANYRAVLALAAGKQPAERNDWDASIVKNVPQLKLHFQSSYQGGANIAIHLRKSTTKDGKYQLAAVDVDDRHGGAQSLKALASSLGPLPETLADGRDGGNQHFYLWVPADDFNGRSRVELAQGVELLLKTANCAPSVSKYGGTRREWAQDPADASWPTLAHLPSSWVDYARALTRKQAPAAPSGTSRAGEESARTDKRIRAFLAKCDPAVSGQRGSATLWRVACYLVHGWDLGPAEALPYLLEWNRVCKPEWPQKDLERTLGNANTKEDKDGRPRGYLRDKDHDGWTGPKPKERRPVAVGTRRLPKKGVAGGPPSDATPPVPNLGRGHKAQPARPEPPPLTDYGNAERLVRRYGRRFRYCYELGAWFVWDGKRWVRDNGKRMERFAKKTTRKIAHDPVERLHDAEALFKWAEKSESALRLAAMIDLARSESGVAVEPAALDADPMLLNCANGTVDLRTGELRPHDRKNLVTKMSPVEYDPDADSPDLLPFVGHVTGGDAEFADYLQKAAGYTVSGLTREEVLFLLCAPGGRGKSTLLEALKSALGDYAMTTDFDTFVAAGGGRPRNDIARIAGARMVIAMESENEGERLAVKVVKSLTGRDTVTARFLYREFFEYRPSFKIWLGVNHAPAVNHKDDAMWRRIHRIPVRNQVTKVDRDLKDRLCDPAAGGRAVLAWAVRGFAAYLRDGLALPAAVRAATEGYRQSMDPLAEFMADRCELGPDKRAPGSSLWGNYTHWCRYAKVDCLSQKAFYAGLAERGCVSKRQWVDGKWQRGWQGVGLKEETDGTDGIRTAKKRVASVNRRDAKYRSRRDLE